MSATRRLVPFAYGFRPFFLLAGLYAAVAIAGWLWLYRHGAGAVAGLPAQFLHGHEMLFGFVAAAIAGFLLTAVPSWAGGRGFAGTPLIVLTLLWLAGRTVLPFASVLPWPVVAVAELAFIPGVMLTIAPSLLRSRGRNTPLLFVLLLYWTADVAWALAFATGNVPLAAAALRGALGLVLVLITVIGGRIVPAFTRNALRQRGDDATMRPRALSGRLAAGLTAAYAIAATAAPDAAVTAGIAALAAAAHLRRLSGWHGLRSGSEPIVWILHVGYLWLPVGLALHALYQLGGVAWAAHWLHALGAGAAGTMILAVMTRAALGHTGRPLRVSPVITAAYCLVTLAVLVRVFGPAVLPTSYATLVTISGGLWLLAFALFIVVYAPILLRPRADGRRG